MTTWQDEVAFAGKAVPRRFSVQAMGRKLLEAEVSIERVADTSAAIFDLPVAQAEPGMTLRPMQIEETRGLRNLDGSFSFSTRAPSNSRATLREIIDRHGAVREVEFLDAQDTSNAASLFGGFEHMRWKPGQQDGSPCELVVNQRLSGEAIDWPAFPIVCTMLFSRMEAFPNALRIEMDKTEIGIDAATVNPARNPTYTVTAPNTTAKKPPSKSARKVNSGRESEAGTKGLKVGFEAIGCRVLRVHKI